MSTITQPLNQFIQQQLYSGVVNSEIEAELAIMEEIKQRNLDRGIKKAQEQYKTGEYTEFNDDFILAFLNKKRQEK